MKRRFALGSAAALLGFALWLLPAAAGTGQELPAWGTEPTPNAGFSPGSLAGVDALSQTDAWAVGKDDQHGPMPLVQHWDGKRWQLVHTPPVAESELLGVAAVAPNDVWMVGGYQSTGEALIMHWDGNALAVVPHPNPGTFN